MSVTNRLERNVYYAYGETSLPFFLLSSPRVSRPSAALDRDRRDQGSPVDHVIAYTDDVAQLQRGIRKPFRHTHFGASDTRCIFRDSCPYHANREILMSLDPFLRREVGKKSDNLIARR